MKVKCINNRDLPWGEKLTVGKVYEVVKSENDHFLVKNDDGWTLRYLSSRFEEVPPTLEEQLQSAKLLVSEIEAQIEAAKPKVGQKYQHSNTDIYLLCKIRDQFCLVKIERNGGNDPVGETYGSLYSNIEQVFSGHDKHFTLLP